MLLIHPDVIVIPPESPLYIGVPADVDFSFLGLTLTVHRPTLVRLWNFVMAIEFKALGDLEQAYVPPLSLF